LDRSVVVPVYPVTTLFVASRAVTVTENGLPAVTDAGAVTLKWLMAPGTKVTWAVCRIAVTPTVAL
jgi:hypothetical protein